MSTTHPAPAPGGTTGVASPALDRRLAVTGVVAAVAATVVILAMHVVGPSAEIDPIRRTISEYALRPGGWAFEGAVAVLALGSAAVLAALVRTDLVRPRSTAAVLLGAWCVGLLLVVAFEKTNWSIGPSVSGYIHRYASLVAFVGLPAGALLLARRWRDAECWRAFRRPVRVLSWIALATFVPIVAAIALRPLTGVPWWRAVPLGLLERALSLAEVAVVILLGLWALAAARERSG